MKTDREVMQQALDALKEIMSWEENEQAIWAEKAQAAIDELRARLVNPESTVQGGEA